MLHKELEQSIALHTLNERTERMRASLEIAALANRQESEPAMLRTLALAAGAIGEKEYAEWLAVFCKETPCFSS